MCNITFNTMRRKMFYFVKKYVLILLLHETKFKSQMDHQVFVIVLGICLLSHNMQYLSLSIPLFLNG